MHRWPPAILFQKLATITRSDLRTDSIDEVFRNAQDEVLLKAFNATVAVNRVIACDSDESLSQRCLGQRSDALRHRDHPTYMQLPASQAGVVEAS